MNRKWFLIVALGLVLVLAATAVTACGGTAGAQGTASSIQVSQQPEGIWVTGTGEVFITPDIATLNLGIASQEATVAEAQAKAAEAMDKVMQALKDNGIEAKDIQTGHFSISQRSRWDDMKQTEVVTGYYVTNMVTVKIRNTAGSDDETGLNDRAGKVIDAVILAGGDLIRINGINFTVDDPAQYYQEVREKAMTAAKEKAEDLAELAGLTLGKPTYILENAQYTPIYGGYANFAMAVPAPTISAGSTSISSGQTSITLTVQVTYSVTK